MSKNELQKFFEKPIILLGAGQLGQMALAMWPQQLKYPVIVLDKNARLKTISGIKCDRHDNHLFDKKYTYILSFFKETSIKINRLFTKIDQPIITVYDVLTHYNPNSFTNGWMEDIKQDELNTLLGSFSLSTNRKIISDVVSWRSNRDLVPSYIVDKEDEKYTFSNELEVSTKHFDLVIDGGSYDGSFISQLKNQDINFDLAVLFEPDSVSMKRVQKNALQFKDLNVESDSNALFSKSTRKSFNASGLLSSRIVFGSKLKNKYPKISCVRLSDILLKYSNERKLSSMRAIVKLHIEGSEWPVISESVVYLSQLREAVLFINLSHDKNSLIKIPPLLASFGFKLTLHSHSLFGEGLTLIAHKEVTTCNEM